MEQRTHWSIGTEPLLRQNQIMTQGIVNVLLWYGSSSSPDLILKGRYSHSVQTTMPLNWSLKLPMRQDDLLGGDYVYQNLILM